VTASFNAHLLGKRSQQETHQEMR